MDSESSGWSSDRWLTVLALVGIVAHLALRWTAVPELWKNLPLWLVLGVGGSILLWTLLKNILNGQWGSDLLAGISIIAAAAMGEYLVGAIIVLMLAGGSALETYASGQASRVLAALAKRMPQTANRREKGGTMVVVPVTEVAAGDTLIVLPHEICPVDGVVAEGHGSMDESFLTGEPFQMSKAPGAAVISGAVNGNSALTIEATKPAKDSRYAQIMRVMEQSEDRKPRLRRVADRLGAWYTPVALALAGLGWWISGDPTRFLAVVVIATPCPLLLAIPIAVVGAISTAARRGILIRNPAILEQIDHCRTFIFDKTGTLTYGRPVMTEVLAADGGTGDSVLAQAASLEQYSKHPLAQAIVSAAQERKLPLSQVESLSERPGEGLRGVVKGTEIRIVGRKHYQGPAAEIHGQAGGLECIVLMDGKYAALLRFRDQPRGDSREFIVHLSKQHGARKTMIVSGDRESEARYLADQVGIGSVLGGQSPEDKVRVVSEETKLAPTLFVGDGINDAPAMHAATVSVAFGKGDIVSEAADAVILDATLERVDELIHIGRRMRRIAMESAVGGMALSGVGMILAVLGLLPPMGGAIAQEVIDLLAVLNAVRVAYPPTVLTDIPK